jgi:hypothetical protein
MKNLFPAMLIIINLNCFAQTKKWFVSFLPGIAFYGPSASLKNQMKAQGYGDDFEGFAIFGDGITHYPRGGAVALMATAGKRITDHKSIYFVAGVCEKATVEGFQAEGWSGWLFSYTTGNYISVSYNIYQLGAGYMFSFFKSRTWVGFAPSIYLFNYGISENNSLKEKHGSIVPGVSLNARIPLGKEKKLFGLELVINGNMAPPVRMKSDNLQGFQPKNANMFFASAGLALSFRK